MNLARELTSLNLEVLEKRELIRLKQLSVGFNELYEIYIDNVAAMRYRNMQKNDRAALEKAGITVGGPLIQCGKGDRRFNIQLAFSSRYNMSDYETIESMCSILNTEEVEALMRDLEMLEQTLMSNAASFYEGANPAYRISNPELHHLSRSKVRSWSYSFNGERYSEYGMRFVAFERTTEG